MPGVAGASGLSPVHFLLANSAGGLVWASAVAVLGYLAGASFRKVESGLSLGGSGLLAAVLVLALAALVVRRVRRGRAVRSEPEPRACRAGVSATPGRVDEASA
jgi:membrane-associated protein